MRCWGRPGRDCWTPSRRLCSFLTRASSRIGSTGCCWSPAWSNAARSTAGRCTDARSSTLPEDQVKLVRRATTSDLFVVGREWRGYVADEIAEIRNVMAGEDNVTPFVRIDEAEVIETTTTSADSTSETSSETSDESTFNEQRKRELDLAISAKGQVDVSARYSSVKLDVSAGFSADFSLKDSTDRATEIAKKAIARAASKVETQTQQERTRRTLTRTELRQRHSLNNPLQDHLRGVFRWVARIDRFQTWRYPDRLQLEFEIP